MPDEMEEIIAEFAAESEETLEKVEPLFIELETKGDDPEILNKLFRSVHTIKGAAGFLGFQPVVDVAHSAENIMKKLRDGDILLTRPLTDAVLKSVDLLRRLIRHIRDKDGMQEDTVPMVRELEHALETARQQKSHADEGNPKQGAAKAAERSGEHAAPHSEEVRTPAASEIDADAPVAEAAVLTRPEKEQLQTLRVDVRKIDKVMDLTGEVVLVRNRLLNIANRLEQRHGDDHDVQSLTEAVSFLDLITSDMQLSVMKMRMQPIEKVFSKFPRLVRDISGSLGKTVHLKVSGEDTEVDKSVIEQIADPMVHIIRNAVDHGLETPQERLAAGKPEAGTISITASQKGNQIAIEVTDDGRGIDLEKVKQKAVRNSLITADEASRMTDEALTGLILLPGFSTADTVTELSGRGVGMDVVKTNISKLNGTVGITTGRETGTVFSIRIPFTLAIIHTLMVRCGASRYAIPLAPVEETLTVSEQTLSDMGNTEALLIRGRIYPLLTLAEIVGTAERRAERVRYAVVIAVGEKRFCLGVDELLGQEEVVIKSVSGIDAGVSHILGATITGDGKVVFILDLAAVFQSRIGCVTA